MVSVQLSIFSGIGVDVSIWNIPELQQLDNSNKNISDDVYTERSAVSNTHLKCMICATDCYPIKIKQSISK